MTVRMLPIAGSVLRRSPLWRQFQASARSSSRVFASRPGAPRARALVRTFGTQSASAVASVENDAFRTDSKRPAEATAAAANAPSDASDDMLFMLEQSISGRQPNEALAYYNCLESPPSGLTSQKLAILLAKQDSLHQTRRAFEILLAVYGAPQFEVHDYAQLASIYTVDACLRQKLLPEALEVFEQAHKRDISLDLPAYDGLVCALVNDGQIERAQQVLTDIVGKQQVLLEQQTFQPLLCKLMERNEFDAVVSVIDHGRKHGVLFTFETYDPLVELGEQVGDAEYEKFCDQLERFMAYINEALEEDGLSNMSDDEDDDDAVAVELDYDDDDEDDDDEDDDDEDFDEDFDDHKY